MLFLLFKSSKCAVNKDLNMFGVFKSIMGVQNKDLRPNLSVISSIMDGIEDLLCHNAPLHWVNGIIYLKEGNISSTIPLSSLNMFLICRLLALYSLCNILAISTLSLAVNK